VKGGDGVASYQINVFLSAKYEREIRLFEICRTHTYGIQRHKESTSAVLRDISQEGLPLESKLAVE